LIDFELITRNLCSEGFHIIDNFLDPILCQSLHTIAQEMHQQGFFRGAKIGLNQELQKNNAIRTDEIFWLDGDETNPAIHAFLAQMHQLAQKLNQELFLGLTEFETHFAVYQPGTYYKKHIDQFTAQKTRKISCVYYLNKDWQAEFGGELKLYNREDQLIQNILPQENRFICFNSELAHEVSLTHKLRYSIAGWLKTRSLSSIF
jgi:SM-20-related protein